MDHETRDKMRRNEIGIDEIRTDEKSRDENFRQIANNTKNDVIIMLFLFIQYV